MHNKKNIKNKITCYLSSLITFNIVLMNWVSTVNAQGTTEANNNSEYGLPTHRRDGGSRGNRNNCIAASNSHNLLALIPEKTVGINGSDSPKLFFYVPKINRAKTLEFVLRNQEDELMYEAFLTTEGEGIVSVEIPADVYSNSIEENKNYRWYLSLICNFQQRSRDIVVEGWMRQEAIDVAIEQELDGADVVEQAELYHEQGFWYDALSVLADNYQSNAERPAIQAKWSELLDSVGLKEVATKPFVESKLIEDSIKQ